MQDLQDISPELVIEEKGLKTITQYYKKLNEVYFLPQLKSKAINSTSLIALLKKSSQYFCPLKDSITRTNAYCPSNYSIKQIHFVANILTYQETSTLLFFKDYADWKFYQTLIRFWDEDIFKTIYQYKPEKSSNLIMTEPLTGYQFVHDFKKDSLLHKKIPASIKEKGGNFFKLQKANIEAELINKPIGLRTINGSKTEYEVTDAYLYHQLHTLSAELQIVEDTYTGLKKSFSKNSKLYKLQRALLKLRIESQVWDTVEHYCPVIDESKVVKELKEASLLEKSGLGYNDKAQEAGLIVDFDSLADYWIQIKTDVEIQKFIEVNKVKNDEEEKKKVDSFQNITAFIVKIKALDAIPRRNNLAWLLKHYNEPDLSFQSSNELIDEYYDISKDLLNIFDDCTPALKVHITAINKNIESLKASKAGILLVDIILDTLVKNNSYVIGLCKLDIYKNFDLALTANSIKTNIWHLANECTNNWTNTKKRDEQCRNIIYLFLLRRGLLEITGYSQVEQRYLIKLFHMTARTVDYDSLYAYLGLLQEVIEEYASKNIGEKYAMVVQELRKNSVPVTAAIYMFIYFVRYKDQLERYVEANQNTVTAFCFRAIEWQTELKSKYTEIESDLFSITAPTKASIEWFKQNIDYSTVKSIMVQLYCKAQMQVDSIHAQAVYKITFELLKHRNDYLLTPAIIKNIKVALNKKDDNLLLLNILKMIFEQRTTFLPKTITSKDFENCNLMIVLSTLDKSSVKMTTEWSQIMMDLINGIVTKVENKTKMLENIVIDDTENVESIEWVLGYTP